MGYQNKSRPVKDLGNVVVDILFDLSDLESDIKSGSSKENLLFAVRYIRQSQKRLFNKLKKQNLFK